MPSFDVVSKVDLQEVDNAVNQTRKEVEQRYDFKGTHNEITLEKDAIVLLGADDYKLQAMIDILKGKLVRRERFPQVPRLRQEGDRPPHGGDAAEGRHRSGDLQGEGQGDRQGDQGEQTQGPAADHGRPGAGHRQADRRPAGSHPAC